MVAYLVEREQRLPHAHHVLAVAAHEIVRLDALTRPAPGAVGAVIEHDVMQAAVRESWEHIVGATNRRIHRLEFGDRRPIDFEADFHRLLERGTYESPAPPQLVHFRLTRSLSFLGSLRRNTK